MKTKHYILIGLVGAVLGTLAGCYSAQQKGASATETYGTKSAKEEPGIYYPVDMVWWPDAAATKLAETDPGTYAQNQVVYAGEEFPAEYLKEEARK